MSTGQQATLDHYVGACVGDGPEPSASDDGAARPASAADERCQDLAAIFEQVTGDATFTEAQEEAPSHAPIEGDYEAPDLSEDGLEDAADSDLQMGGWI